MAEETQLSEKVSLSGFADEDGLTMGSVNKMVSNYVSKLDSEFDDFRKLTITLKKVHSHPDGKGGQKGGKNELHFKADLGKVYASEVVDFNLLVGLDAGFKKVLAECQKK